MKHIIKTALVSSAALAGLAFAPAASAADSLEIRDFIGSINWSNGPMAVEILENPGETVILGKNNISVNGGVEKPNGKDCKSSYSSVNIDLFGKKKKSRSGGYKSLEDYPLLNITVPADTKLIIRNSIVFTLGEPDLDAADIELRHCGKVSLGDVENTLALDSRGSADLDVGRTGAIVAHLKGSGDLTGGNSGDVLVDASGSGGAELGNIASLELSSMGSGDFDASDVNGSAEISSNGSGDAELGDVAGSLIFAGRGSGDLDVGSVTGQNLDLKTYGSGDANIDGGRVETLTIEAYGSGGAKFDGQAATANLTTFGSGDIRVDRVDQLAKVKSAGSGDIKVGNGQ